MSGYQRTNASCAISHWEVHRPAGSEGLSRNASPAIWQNNPQARTLRPPARPVAVIAAGTPLIPPPYVVYIARAAAMPHTRQHPRRRACSRSLSLDPTAWWTFFRHPFTDGKELKLDVWLPKNKRKLRYFALGGSPTCGIGGAFAERITRNLAKSSAGMHAPPSGRAG